MSKNTLSSYEMFRAMWQEVQIYKWTQSQEEGEDIGLDRALIEWQAKHSATWRKTIESDPSEEE